MIFWWPSTDSGGLHRAHRQNTLRSRFLRVNLIFFILVKARKEFKRKAFHNEAPNDLWQTETQADKILVNRQRSSLNDFASKFNKKALYDQSHKDYPNKESVVEKFIEDVDLSLKQFFAVHLIEYLHENKSLEDYCEMLQFLGPIAL